ncbi:MAG: heat-inducible transcription repressor HrcA [Nitrospirae bacterium]|nr:heat-inducible transcription repressor HrcA [Nitrospirota bacterium]
MDERVQRILKAVITTHIETGEPIGSRTISKRYNFGLSPATIRNIMADLEEMDYLSHPYTSSGRVPTEKGYRHYIDNLISDNEMEYIDEEEFAIRYQHKKMAMSELLHETSLLLSMLSHYTGVVTMPRFTSIILKYLKFIGLEKRCIMVIFVSQEGIVLDKVFEVDVDYSQNELDGIALYVNKELEGYTIGEIKDKLLEGMRMDRAHYNELLIKVFKNSEDSFSKDGEIYLEGTTNVLNHPEFSDVEKMKYLFKAFEEKYTILKLLNKCLDSEGVNVYIGLGSLGINNCSVVAANYRDGNRVLGTIGVIGPTRMEYSKVIPLVDVTARVITKTLSRG